MIAKVGLWLVMISLDHAGAKCTHALLLVEAGRWGPQDLGGSVLFLLLLLLLQLKTKRLGQVKNFGSSCNRQSPR